MSENKKNPKKPYLNTFTSIAAFQLFEEFCKKELTINNEYATYGFLYNSMKKDGFIHPIRHMDFMFFLEKEYGSKILDKGYSTFNISYSQKKEQLYSNLKDKFF